MNRKGVFLIVLLCIVALAGAAHAVTLEQGWYAQIRGVSMEVYDQDGVPIPWGFDPYFNTPPGMYGPFQVTNDPRGNSYSRTVSVPSTVYGVAPGTSVELPLITSMADTSVIASMSVDVRTNYDASGMRLQLIGHDQSTGGTTVLWEQAQSNDYWHGVIMACDVYPAGLAFRVMAVPEPGGASSLLMCVVGTGFLPLMRRRRP